MPAADSPLIAGLDDVDLGGSPPEEPVWASTVPKVKAGGKKKKGRKHAVARPAEEQEASDEPVHGLAASPPDEHENGVSLREELLVQNGRSEQREQDRFVEANGEGHGDGFVAANGGYEEDEFGQEPTFMFSDAEGAPARPQPQPTSIPATASPDAASPRPSPRPAPARPVAGSHSPASQYATPYGQPEQYAGVNGYRRNSTTTRPRRESYTAVQSSPRQPYAEPVPRSSPNQRYVQPVQRASPNQRNAEPVPRASPQQRFVEPVAPPHMPQPHFYGLPDFGLDIARRKEQADKAAGSNGYCCCFDSFADGGDLLSSKKARTALLVGSEGGLEVFRVLPTKFEVIGRLEGLRGSVVGAKILPQTCHYDALQGLRPLVAVVVHGPFDSDPGHDVNGDRRRTQASATHYQTTVEVYSLQTQHHVTTLYWSPVVALEQEGHSPTIPGPVGDLRIAAHGKFVMVTSGKSGEVFVFTHVPASNSVQLGFRCIGKLWTSLQTSLQQSQSRPTSSSEGAEPTEGDRKPGVPLLGLSQRWLAIVPPSTASHVSIQGTPLLSDLNSSPPGLATHVAPPQPSVTADIAGVDAEGTLSRLSRQAAKGVVRYSQKGIEMGWQGWNELVNPTTQASQQQGRAGTLDERFPPTKAPPDDPRRRAEEPVVVSIIDLETLLEAEDLKSKYPPAPMATIALDEGCNHLSFSSNGLRLLTVSRTGEVSTVWDLEQASRGVVKYLASGQEDGTICSPCVKQIVRIPRSSQSVVIESVWSRDDEYLAILTTHGTVHLHEIPAKAPRRKRKRKGTLTTAVPEKAQPTVGISHGVSPPSNTGFFGSLRSGLQQVSTQVGTMRANNSVSLGIPTLAGLRETAASTSHAGSRMLAKGLSQGFSAARSGATEYWHAEDNKIRHKILQDATSTGSLRWIKRQSGTLLAVAAGGTVHLHPITRVERRRGDQLVSGLKHDKYQKKHFDLPKIHAAKDDRGPPQARRSNECAAAGPHGVWMLRASASPTQSNHDRVSRISRQPPTQANEVETNPPYCPFHVDSRLNIYTFDDASRSSQINLRTRNAPDSRTTFFTQGQQDPASSGDQDRWVFGGPLPPSTKLNTHEEPLANELGLYDQGLTDADMEGLADQVESRLTVQSAGEAGEQIRVHTSMMRAERDRSGEIEELDDDDYDDYDAEPEGRGYRS